MDDIENPNPFTAASPESPGVLVGLGGNLPFGALAGAPLLTAALDALARAGLPVRRVSRVWRTPPLGASGATLEGQPMFVNAVAALDVALADPGPDQVYAIFTQIEKKFGRVRAGREAPRTLDLDLLDFAGRVQGWAAPPAPGALILPHPRLHQRAFVLHPLCEIAPEWRHPVLGRTALELRDGLGDDQGVAPLVADGPGWP